MRRKGSQDNTPVRGATRQRVPETQGSSYAQVADSALTRVKGSLENAPRACIAIKGFDALLVPNRFSRDLVVINMRLKGRIGVILFLMGCDANAHHLVWGSTDTNGRFLADTDI